MGKRLIQKKIGKVKPEENNKGIKQSSQKKSKVEEVQEFLAKMDPKIPISERIGPSKGKKLSEDKYIRLSENSNIEKFKEMSDKIQNKTHEWAYYAIDGDKGYHYYRIL